MPTAYSYVRFSTPEQAQGDSLRRQLEASRAWADANGYHLDETLRDLGRSAYSGDHLKGHLGAFLEAVDDGKVEPGSVLLVESLDRLSRQAVLDALQQLIAILNRGIVVVTLVDGQTYTREGLGNNFAQLLVSLTIMLRAHEESATKGKRVAAAWAQKRVRAANSGEALTAICPAWLRLADGAYQAIPDRVEVIQKIFDLCISGMGRRAIAQRLNRDGIPSFGGGRGWHLSYVKSILTTRAVMGEFQPHKKIAGKRIPDGEVIKNYFPKIVDEPTFYRAAAALASRQVGASGPRGSTVKNLFRGLSRCAHCGAIMAYRNRGVRGGEWLSCDTRDRGGPCINGKAWKYDSTFEHKIISALTRVDFSALSDTPDESKIISNNLQIAQSKYGEVSNKIISLMKLLEETPSKALAVRLSELEAEADALEVDIRSLKESLKTSSFTKSSVQDSLNAVLNLLSNADGDRYLIRSQIAAELRKSLKSLEFSVDGDVIATYSGAALPVKLRPGFNDRSEGRAAVIGGRRRPSMIDGQDDDC